MDTKAISKPSALIQKYLEICLMLIFITEMRLLVTQIEFFILVKTMI